MPFLMGAMQEILGAQGEGSKKALSAVFCEKQGLALQSLRCSFLPFASHSTQLADERTCGAPSCESSCLTHSTAYVFLRGHLRPLEAASSDCLSMATWYLRLA